MPAPVAALHSRQFWGRDPERFASFRDVFEGVGIGDVFCMATPPGDGSTVQLALMDRARGALRRASPEEALSLWDALVDGRWSLIDHVDSDGRRYVLARRNPPGFRDLRALAPRECAVLALAAQGRSNKNIAAELGLAPSTVAGNLRSCQGKLGVSSRRALIELVSGTAASTMASACRPSVAR
jgi:DNA-binding NarL/FixJ family response regulator